MEVIGSVKKFPLSRSKAFLGNATSFCPDFLRLLVR